MANLDKSSVQLSLDREIYPENSLRAAVEAFAAYCKVQSRKSLDGRIEITIDVLPELRPESSRIIGEFLNYLLDHSLREILLGESAP
ncbi:MAG TPA: HxsD-like protein [Nitrospira sp.]|nr:HxsD-like protein [Nitrospira sp.]